MKFQFVMPLVAALAALLAVETQARAGHCGATSASCCPTDCCVPKVRYKTSYQTVKECKQVCTWENRHTTVMKDVIVVECKPIYEKKDVEVTRIVCEPRWEERKVKVCCGEYVTVQHTVPGGCTTRREWVEGTCCVDPCTGCTRKTRGHFEKVTCRAPDKVCCKKVWVPREEERTVKVCVMDRKEVKEKQTITTCRMERVEVKKQVPVTVCEKVQVVKNVEVCRRVKVCVPECVCEKPSCLDRLRSRFSHGKGCGNNGCCDSGCGNAAHYAPAQPEVIKTNPMPK